VEKELLDSWKEISAYLNRNIRTCQYWEKKHGLPVHRLEDSPKARVFAYKKELNRWMEEKLHKGELSKKGLLFPFLQKNKTPLILVTTLLSLVIVVVFILKLFREKEAIKLPSLKPSVMILPFVNNSGDRNLDYLSQTLSNLLITDLSQSRHVSVLGRERVFSILLQLDLHKTRDFTSEDLERIAREADISHVVQGRYIKLGDTLRIDVDVIEILSMESIGTDKIEGIGLTYFKMIDELTKRIKSHLRLTDEAFAQDIDERVGKVTTNSPEAYRHYIEGLNLFNLNEYDKSIDLMRKALEIDREFASAYWSISKSYDNLGLLSKSREYAEKALEFRDGITDRERFYLQFQFYKSTEKTWDKAIDAGVNFIRLYPDDLGGNDLATLYFLLEQWDRATEHFQVLVLNQEISNFPYMGMASSYGAKGLYDRSYEILEGYLHDISEHYSIREQLALLYLCQGKYDLALKEANKIDPPNSDIKGPIFQCRGELDKAEREYFYMLDSRISRDVASGYRLLGSLYTLQGRYNDAEKFLQQGVSFANQIDEFSWKHEIHSELANLYLVSGIPEKALTEINKALEYAVEEESIRRLVDSLHFKGLIFVGKKLLDDAQKTADKLKNLVDSWFNRKLLRYYYHLTGEIKLERKNLPEAVRDFKNAIRLLPYPYYEEYFRLPVVHALFYDSLARAYSQSENSESALDEYKKITSLTIGRLWNGHIYRNSYYKMAEIFELKAQREEAIKHYEKFLILLKDADPAFPEVKEAQKRLAALKSAEKRNSPQ
jgi:tetratricopeptide (TPR) repeat protein